MRESGFLRARQARKLHDERRIPAHQKIERGLHGAEVVKVVHAIGARTEFAGSLRSTKQEDAEESGFAAIEIEGLLKRVGVFCDAAVSGIGRAGEAFLLERAKRGADGVFIERHYGLAIRFLIAGVDERVERKRIVFGRGDFFFDERAEYAGFFL